jgi:hypothetical protein
MPERKDVCLLPEHVGWGGLGVESRLAVAMVAGVDTETSLSGVAMLLE